MLSSNSHQKDINHWPVLWANIYICTLPSIIVIMLPLLVGGVVESFGYSEQQGGFIVSGDMAGYTLGTIASYFFIDKINWRQCTLFCLVVMAIANLICGWVSEFETLLALRFLSGIGGGIVTAIMFAVIGQSKNPDSGFGLWLVSQTIFASLGSITFVDVMSRWGIGGGFVIFSGLILIAMTMIACVPNGAKNRSTAAQHMPLGKWRNIKLGVFAIMIIYIAIIAVYSYLERMGVAASLSLSQIGECFFVMTIAGGFGGLAATLLGSKIGRTLPAILAALGFIMSFFLLAFMTLNYIVFMLICSLFFAAWSFLLPYLMAALTAVDSSGRAVAMGNGALGLGLTLGPFIGALIISDGYDRLLLSSTVVFIAGIVLVLPLLQSEKCRDSVSEDRCTAV